MHARDAHPPRPGDSNRHRAVTRGRVTTDADRDSTMTGEMAALIYLVSFKGAVSPTLRAAFQDSEVETADGVTVVRCPRDRLRPVIAVIEEFGLELADVRMLAEPDDVGGRRV